MIAVAGAVLMVFLFALWVVWYMMWIIFSFVVMLGCVVCWLVVVLLRCSASMCCFLLCLFGFLRLVLLFLFGGWLVYSLFGFCYLLL